jgi:hypothetical protein
MFTFGATWAQRTVTGTVTGADDGTPIPGVNVLLKGSSVGTVTDIEGNYQIAVPDDGSVLVFSFIGLVTEEVLVGNQSTINMIMSADLHAIGGNNCDGIWRDLKGSIYRFRQRYKC